MDAWDGGFPPFNEEEFTGGRSSVKITGTDKPATYGDCADVVAEASSPIIFWHEQQALYASKVAKGLRNDQPVVVRNKSFRVPFRLKKEEAMNWGLIIANIGIVLGVLTTAGYLAAGNWRKALYFFLGAAISAVVTWLL
jgi:hypothetical protein